MNVSGSKLSMTRGDSESITISCSDQTGAPVPFEAGDTVYLTVKNNANSDVALIQKVVTVFEDGKAVVGIVPADTKGLTFRSYTYDVQLTKANGQVRTIVLPSEFIILSEVTYE